MLNMFGSESEFTALKYLDSSVWRTCQAAHVDNTSSGPPQQREEDLTHVHSCQEVHLHTTSVHWDRVELCVHGAVEDSCIVHQTPQTFRDRQRQKKPVLSLFTHSSGFKLRTIFRNVSDICVFIVGNYPVKYLRTCAFSTCSDSLLLQ